MGARESGETPDSGASDTKGVGRREVHRDSPDGRMREGSELRLPFPVPKLETKGEQARLLTEQGEPLGAWMPLADAKDRLAALRRQRQNLPPRNPVDGVQGGSDRGNQTEGNPR